jgi:hypothetical protein
VEGFIDRLADFLRSLTRGSDTRGSGSGGGSGDGGSSAGRADPGTRFRDPDLQDAWEELDEYMRTGSNTSKARSSGRGGHQSARPQRPVDESLRQDYANLEVPFGSDIETVKQSYKRMMLKYHPDRFGREPEKQKIALEMTKKINASFERIRSHHEGGAAS